MVEEGETAV